MKKLILIAVLGIIATSCSMDPEVSNTTINNYYSKKIPVDSVGVGFIEQPWVDQDSIIG